MKTTFKSVEEFPMTLQVNQVADAMGLSLAGAYQLIHSDGFPVMRVGRRMLVPKQAFIEWIANNIGNMSGATE